MSFYGFFFSGKTTPGGKIYCLCFSFLNFIHRLVLLLSFPFFFLIKFLSSSCHILLLYINFYVALNSKKSDLWWQDLLPFNFFFWELILSSSSSFFLSFFFFFIFFFLHFQLFLIYSFVLFFFFLHFVLLWFHLPTPGWHRWYHHLTLVSNFTFLEGNSNNKKSNSC